VRIRGGDVAELGADAAQSEERPGALQRVLRLGQPALLERTRERASCLAGVSGGSGREAADAGAAADHAQVASRRASASLVKRIGCVECRTP